MPARFVDVYTIPSDKNFIIMFIVPKTFLFLLVTQKGWAEIGTDNFH